MSASISQKIEIDQSCMSKFSDKEKQSYLNCIHTINQFNTFEIFIFQKFVQFLDLFRSK